MRALLAAALIVGQGMPVTRLAGGAAGQAAAPPGAAQPTTPGAPGLPVTRIDAGQSAALDSPRRLSLAFSEPRPIGEVLRLLIAGTPFSLGIDPDVTGSFRGELKQLSLREALNTVLSPPGFEFHVDGTVIRVTRHRTDTRQFEVNLLAVERGLNRTTGAPDLSVSTTLPPGNAFAGVAEGVQALLSTDGRVHVDARAGLVQVTDYPERLDRVAVYLETLQARSSRQVRLQARVVEVTLRDAAAIDWGTVRDKLGLARETPDAGLAADPAALQAALAEQGDVRVLSAPEVTVLNNEPALLRTGTPGLAALSMTVVPQIGSDGIVQLSVAHAWEEQQAGDKLPHTALADTVTRVTDGSTVLIAGLLRARQVDAPSRGVSALSGGASKKTAQAELVVLLRASIVRGDYGKTGRQEDGKDRKIDRR